MSALKYFLAPVLLATLSLPSQARWFEIEVLLFARNLDPTELDEDFSQSRFVPMKTSKLDLFSSILLAPTDCPEPEPEPINEGFLEQNIETDELGFPSTTEPLTQQVLNQEPPPENLNEEMISPERASSPAWDELEDGTAFDEFGFPIDSNAEPVRTAEEQAAYEQWLLSCQKPKQLNEFDLLPVTMTLSEVPETDETPYVLTSNDLQLIEALAKLARNPNYQPLLHTGWRMDIANKRQMPAIRLHAGQNFGQQFNADGWEHLEQFSFQDDVVQEFEAKTTGAQVDGSPTLQQPLETLEPLAPSISTEEALFDTDALIQELLTEQSAPFQEPRQDAVWEMQTDIRIWLASWLHMEVQSTLRQSGRKTPQDLAEQIEPEAEQQAELESAGTLMANAATVPYLYRYHMDQFRRVRSEEIHYFDHPLMGLIIQIRAYTPREISEDDEGATDVSAPGA